MIFILISKKDSDNHPEPEPPGPDPKPPGPDPEPIIDHRARGSFS